MSKKISLSEEQVSKLTKLWFVYGNNGKKCTLFNHKLIQGFVEDGEDRRGDYADVNKNMLSKYGPEFSKDKVITDDCLQAISEILDSK